MQKEKKRSPVEDQQTRITKNRIQQIRKEHVASIITRHTLNARILGAGNLDSVSSSANVLQAAKAAALFPSSAASSAP